MPFFCISEPLTPGSALRLNADVLLVSDSMDPPTALSWILLEPLDTSLETETRVRTTLSGAVKVWLYTGYETHLRVKEISSRCVLCSGCPFSPAAFILYC